MPLATATTVTGLTKTLAFIVVDFILGPSLSTKFFVPSRLPEVAAGGDRVAGRQGGLHLGH